MTTFAKDSESPSADAHQSIVEALDSIEAIIPDEYAPLQADASYRRIKEALQVLHARMRVHHANGLDAGESVCDRMNAPELMEEEQRLNDEHKCMIGQLDRLIREADSMGDQPGEDQVVFTHRIREITAIIRRHDAEDRRLLYRAAWRDTGGES